MSHKRRIVVAFLLSLVILLSFPVSACAGLYTFSTDTDKVLESFVNEYGWDREKIEASEWLGVDGKTTYSRAAGMQKEYFEELFQGSKEYCVENNLITVPSVGGAGGYNIAAVARAEVDAPDSMENPMGSNRTKYNDWYFNRPGEEAAWCVIFVSWCAEQCGLIESGLYRKDAGVSPGIYEYMTQENGFSSYTWREVKQLGGGAYTAVPGDLFFFEGMGHIGIVTNVTDSSIEVTHGNADPGVVRATLMSANGYMDRGTIVHVEYPNDESAIFYFVTKHMGAPASSACGIIANIEHESGFNPNALGDGGTSYGLCQWHNSRWESLKAFCDANGYDWETMDGQLYYLEYEITEGGEAYTGIYPIIMNMPDDGDGAYRAGYEWCVKFERPAAGSTAGVARGNSARDNWYPIYGGLG